MFVVCHLFTVRLNNNHPLNINHDSDSITAAWSKPCLGRQAFSRIRYVLVAFTSVLTWSQQCFVFFVAWYTQGWRVQKKKSPNRGGASTFPVSGLWNIIRNSNPVKLPCFRDKTCSELVQNQCQGLLAGTGTVKQPSWRSKSKAKVLTCIARGDPSTRPGRESPRQKEPPWMADGGRQAFTEFHSISWGVRVSFNITQQLQRNEEAYYRSCMIATRTWRTDVF